MATATDDRRVERLNAASAARIIDPDHEIPGALGDPVLLGDELLFAISGLDPARVNLDEEQKTRLSRALVAGLYETGTFFEVGLLVVLSLEMLHTPRFTDPRTVYMLHEVGEETRHSRLFIRLLNQLDALDRRRLDRVLGKVFAGFSGLHVLTMPATSYAVILIGEEMPDVLQKVMCERPGTDPFLREVSLYHRKEEARHLSFARLRLREALQTTNPVDRLLVRYGLPVLVNEVFPLMFRPAVYRAAGLPGVRSWIEARSSPQRRDLVQQAGRSLVGALVNAGAFSADRVTWPWRWLAGSGHEPATTEKAGTRAQPPPPAQRPVSAVPAVPVTPVAGTSAGVVRELIGRFAPEPEPAPGPDVRLIEDLDYDSLALMELAVAIGNAVGLEIGDAEAFEMFVEVGTVAEVESLVADALARQVR